MSTASGVLGLIVAVFFILGGIYTAGVVLLKAVDGRNERTTRRLIAPVIAKQDQFEERFDREFGGNGGGIRQTVNLIAKELGIPVEDTQ